MSRSPTPTTPQAPSPARKASTALALHRVGGSYRYVIAGLGGGGGNGTAGSVRVTDSGTISAADPKALEALRSKAGSSAAFVQVIPPEATILRNAPPKLTLDGTPEQVAGALGLVAEAELPSTIPAHRRAAGVLRAGHAHAVYAVGWLGAEGAIAPDATPVPAVAALAALHRFSGAPDGVAAWADQSSGVVAIVAAGKGESPRLFVRILRDDSSDTDAFAAVRDEAIADARADLDAPEPVSIGRALRLPRHPSHNPGVTGEDKLSDYALALGAAAAVMEGKPDEQPLFTMADRSPTAGRTVFKRVADGLSSPKALAVTAAACVVLLLGGWILAAPIKLAILHNRVGNDTGDYTKAIQQHDWYKALRDKRWPMTALMAELTSAAPQGVHVETLTMEQGRPITLTGSAETADSVYAWCKSLRGKIFTEAKPTIPREDVQPVRFSIRADVADAMAAAVSELKPVAVSEATRPPRSDSGSRTDRNTPRNNNNGRSNNGGNNNGRSTQPAGRTPAATPSQAVVEVPPAMTDAQIDRLNSGTAMLEWAKRKGQVNRTDLDGATRARLEHEIQRIEARRKALEGGAK